MNSVPSNLDNPLYNSRIIDTYIRLIRARYPDVNVHDLLTYAGMEIYEVKDPGHWFSQRQINRFHKRLAQITRNPQISREAGRYAASPDAVGLIRPYILGMIDPAKAYSMVGLASSKFTRSTRFEPCRLSPNKVEIRVTPREGVQEQSFQCENRIGFLESIGAGFLNKFPRVDHSECIFTGGQCCRYVITWEKSVPFLWRRLSPIILGAIGLGMALSAMFLPGISVTAGMVVALVIALIISLVCEEVEKGDLKRSHTHLMDSTEKLLDQINVNYNNSIITNEIGLAISGKTNVAEVLNSIIQTLQNRLDFDRGMILLANAAGTRLEFKAGFGYDDSHRLWLDRLYFSLDKPKSKGVFIVSHRDKKAFLIDDLDVIENELSPRSLEFARKVGSKSFICCPILSDGKSLGILAVDNLNTDRPLVETDLRLLKGVASVLGISIKNAQLIEARERQMNSILRVLGASIDARDPLTKGHSENVTLYAMGICDELSVGRDYKEAVRVAALLHDYGKIGVPDAVLKKPGSLTMDEIRIVRTHAQKTKEILEQVNFEGVFAQVPQIAGGHHERYDGSGYPDGLKGEEIPLGARIIAVADFFEAITSMRHYRAPMTEENALLLLQSKSQTHFDPAAVDAFMTFYKQQTPRKPWLQVLSA